jgi:hypothetical protein
MRYIMRARKTCQGKNCRFLSYTRANKTRQGKLVKENLFVGHTSKCTRQGNLSRKNCSSVRGFYTEDHLFLDV